MQKEVNQNDLKGGKVSHSFSKPFLKLMVFFWFLFSSEVYFSLKKENVFSFWNVFSSYLDLFISLMVVFFAYSSASNHKNKLSRKTVFFMGLLFITTSFIFGFGLKLLF